MTFVGLPARCFVPKMLDVARLNHSRLLRYAGLFTWAVIGMPLLLLSLMPSDQGALAEEGAPRPTSTGRLGGLRRLRHQLGWLTRGLGTRRVGAFDYVLLMVLTGSAIGMSYYSASGLGSILLMVAACVLPWLLPLPRGRGLAGAQRIPGRAGVHALAGHVVAGSADAVVAVCGLFRLRVRHQPGRAPAGAGARGAAPAQRGTARHARAAGRKRAR